VAYARSLSLVARRRPLLASIAPHVGRWTHRQAHAPAHYQCRLRCEWLSPGGSWRPAAGAGREADGAQHTEVGGQRLPGGAGGGLIRAPASAVPKPNWAVGDHPAA
jgi:hypothetical protein